MQGALFQGTHQAHTPLLSTAAKRSLTQALITASDLQGLSALVHRWLPSMDAIHVSAALVRVARLAAQLQLEVAAPQPGQWVDPDFGRGGSSSYHSTPSGSSSDGSTDSSRRFTTRRPAPVRIQSVEQALQQVHELLPALLRTACSRDMLATMDARQAANMLWACGSLHANISGWRAAVISIEPGRQGPPSHNQQQEQQLEQQQQGEGTTTHACASTEQPAASQQGAGDAAAPTPVCMRSHRRAWRAGVRERAARALHITDTLLDTLRAAGGPLSSLVQQQAGACAPQALSNTLWGLMQMGLRPSTHWCAGYWAASTRLLQQQQLSEQQQPHQGTATTTQQGRSHYGPQELVNTLTAVARLRLRPPSGWWAGFMGAAAQQMGGMDQQGLSNMLWAFATLRVAPGEAFMASWWVGCARCVCAVLVYACALWALAMMRVVPGWAFMASLWLCAWTPWSHHCGYGSALACMLCDLRV